MIWIVTHVEESDGVVSTALVSESEVETYFRSEAIEIGDGTQEAEDEIVKYAMASFTKQKDKGGLSAAFPVSLRTYEHHFQRLYSALYLGYLTTVDFLTLKSTSK